MRCLLLFLFVASAVTAGAQVPLAALTDSLLADSIRLTEPYLRLSGNDSLMRHGRWRWQQLRAERGRRNHIVIEQARWAPVCRLEALSGQHSAEAVADSIIDLLVVLDTLNDDERSMACFRLLAQTRTDKACRYFARRIGWMYFTGYEDQFPCLVHFGVCCADVDTLAGYIFDSLRDDPHNEEHFWFFWAALHDRFDNTDTMQAVLRPLIRRYAGQVERGSRGEQFCRYVEERLDEY